MDSLATLIGGPYSNYLMDAAAIKIVRGSWVRVVIPWGTLEPWPNAYNWQAYDNALLAAASYGLKVIVLITGPVPAWGLSRQAPIRR